MPTGSRSRNATWRWVLAVVAVLGLVAAACGDDDDGGASDTTAGGADTTVAGADTTVAGEPVSGGRLVVGIEADTSSPWTPAQMTCPVACHMVARSVYDTLALIGEDGEAVPNLAAGIEPNADYTQWRITAREGVTFHDGTPFDGAAIADNLTRQKNSFLTGKILADVTSIEVDPADPMTVVVTMGRPWVKFPIVLAAQPGYIASPTWLAAVDGDPSLATQPVGTGPFVFESYQTGQGYTGTKNPDYWREGMPYLDEIEFRIIPDGETRQNALLAGDIDVMHTDNGDVISQLREQADQFPMPEVTDGGETVYFLLNVGDETSPLADRDVRCALAQATDTATIRSAVTNDVPALANGPFAPDRVGYLEDTGYPTYDPEAAKAAIEAWEADNGPLEIAFATTNDSINLLTGQLVQQMWNDAGAETSIEQIEQGQFIVTALQGDFQVFQWRNHGAPDPDGEYVWWHSSSALPVGELALNFGRIRDDVIDENLDVIRTNPDPAVRQEAAEAINRRFGEQCYNLWYNWTVWALPHDPSVQGVLGMTSPDGLPVMEGLGNTSGAFYPQALWIEQ